MHLNGISKEICPCPPPHSNVLHKSEGYNSKEIHTKNVTTSNLDGSAKKIYSHSSADTSISYFEQHQFNIAQIKVSNLTRWNQRGNKTIYIEGNLRSILKLIVQLPKNKSFPPRL